MHPPAFSVSHRLSDWPECVLELNCPKPAGRMVQYPVRLLAQRHGNLTFAELLPKLRCKCCGQRPAPVHFGRWLPSG
jgi:hypothetical protein